MSSLLPLSTQPLGRMAEPFRKVLRQALDLKAERLTLYLGGDKVIATVGKQRLHAPFPDHCWTDLVVYLSMWHRLAQAKFPACAQISIFSKPRSWSTDVAYHALYIDLPVKNVADFRDQLTELEQQVMQQCATLTTPLATRAPLSPARYALT